MDEEQKHCFRVLSDYYHLLREWKIKYFNEDAKETMKDKIKRLIENDVKATQHTA